MTVEMIQEENYHGRKTEKGEEEEEQQKEATSRPTIRAVNGSGWALSKSNLLDGNGHGDSSTAKAAAEIYVDPFAHPLAASSSTTTMTAAVDSLDSRFQRMDMLPANWTEAELGLDVTDLSPFCDTEELSSSEGLETPRPDRARSRLNSGKLANRVHFIPGLGPNAEGGSSSSSGRVSSSSGGNMGGGAGLLAQAKSILQSSFPGSIKEDAEDESHAPLTPSLDQGKSSQTKGRESEDNGVYPPMSETTRVESTLRRWEREEMERRAAARRARANANRKAKNSKRIIPSSSPLEPMRSPLPNTLEEALEDDEELAASRSEEDWQTKGARWAHQIREIFCGCCDIGEDDPHLNPRLQYGDRDDDNANYILNGGSVISPPISSAQVIDNGKQRLSPSIESVVGHPVRLNGGGPGDDTFDGRPSDSKAQSSNTIGGRTVDVGGETAKRQDPSASKYLEGSSAAAASHNGIHLGQKRRESGTQAWMHGGLGQTGKTNPFE